MYDEGKRVHFLFVNKDIQFHQLRLYVSLEFIVKGCISSGTGLQRIEEIINDLIEGKIIFQKGTGLLNIFHTKINSAALLAKIHNRTDKFRRYHNLRTDHRLFHIFDLGWIRQVGRIGQFNHLPIRLMHPVNNARRCGHQIKVILSLQTFLNDFQVQ